MSQPVLYWEHGQDIIDTPLRGHLTRTKGGVSDLQLDLIKKVKKSGNSKLNHSLVLLAHFAFLGFNEPVPLFGGEMDVELKPKELSTTQKVLLNSAAGKLGVLMEDAIRPSIDFAHGTFNTNIAATYKEIFNNRPGETVFDYIISGHTHRPAAYFITSPPKSDCTVRYSSSSVTSTPRTLARGIAPCIMIAGSGGPIGKQNYSGEFHKWGHISPSGNYVLYQSGGISQYGIVKFEKDSAGYSTKPRFAVAMDYYNIMEKPVFSKFESTEAEPHVLYLKINKKIFPDLFDLSDITIESMYLYYYNYDIKGFNQIDIKNINKGGNLLFSFTTDKTELEKALREIKRATTPLEFLSIKFNPLKAKGFNQYDYSSPWVFRIGILDHRKLEHIQAPTIHIHERSPLIKAVHKGIEIKTHRDAEEPNFGLYAELFPDDYPMKKVQL